MVQYIKSDNQFPSISQTTKLLKRHLTHNWTSPLTVLFDGSILHNGSEVVWREIVYGAEHTHQ